MKKIRLAIYSIISLALVTLNLITAHGQPLNRGLIPDEVHNPTLDTFRSSEYEYQDPYKGIIGPSQIKTINNSNITSTEMYGASSAVDSFSMKDQSDPVASALNSFARAPSSTAAQAEPVNFDYVKSNADRFINSPCFKELGFDPRLSFQLQNAKYEDCEAGKRDTQTSNIIKLFFGILVTGFLIFVVYYYTKKLLKHKNERPVGTNQSSIPIISQKADNRSSNGLSNNDLVAENIVDKLLKLKTLLDDHLISKQEYEKIKNDLLSNI